jgi:2-phospho-L-lactate guanylyltransferase
VPTVAILPVKSFSLGKGRLAGPVADHERSALGRALAEHTADVAVEAGLIPLLVAGDGEVAEWALGNGLPVIPDTGGGLDGAAAAGVAWAVGSASDWIVVHTDLPLLTPSEVGDVVAPVRAGMVAIAPSADGGTSAMAGSGPATGFAYGPGIFHRHLARNPGAAIVVRLGLLHDVDTYPDLVSARSHERGAWMASIT